MPVLQLDEFKTRQRAVWDAGEYSALSPFIADVGRARRRPRRNRARHEVLDVACGTGNAARPAARAGARVTGLDLVPKLLEAGRAKAEAEGLEIEWREGDAEALPFEDGQLRPRALDVRAHVRAAPPADRRRDGARVSQGRHHRHCDLDARGHGGRDLQGERLVHASAAGLRLAADPLGP